MKKITAAVVFMNMDFCNDDTNLTLTLTLTDLHDACETVFGDSGILCILAVSGIRVSGIRADPHYSVNTHNDEDSNTSRVTYLYELKFRPNATAYHRTTL